MSSRQNPGQDKFDGENGFKVFEPILNKVDLSLLHDYLTKPSSGITNFLLGTRKALHFIKLWIQEGQDAMGKPESPTVVPGSKAKSVVSNVIDLGHAPATGNKAMPSLEN